MIRISIICLALGFKFLNAGAQAVLGVSGGGGFVWAHADYVRHLATSHNTRIFINYIPNAWAKLPDLKAYHQAQLGVMAGWVNFRSARLGSAFPIMFSFSNALGPGQARVGLYYHIGAGLAYVTSPYSYDNYRNTAIGSHVTFSIQASGFMQIGLGDKQSGSYKNHIRVEGGLLHFSDGAVRLPNAGANLPFLQVGFLHTYQPVGVKAPHADSGKRLEQSAPSVKGKYFVTVSAGGGPKQAGGPNSPERMSYVGTASVVHKYGRRSAILAGTDYFYSKALDDERAGLGLAGHSRSRIGIWIGHDWLVATAAVTTQFGYYLYNGLPQSVKPVYQRYGVRFCYGQRFSPAVLLRSHFAKADGVEFQLSYRLYNSKNYSN